ncbi:thioesterase [Kitasatospora sp. NE20-6]|uniref:acyl-CoA thioesterase n=1 Tax=Kitasatospora sp. NE20-6 TaxID=2859066 RepID=UPI0034DC842F
MTQVLAPGVRIAGADRTGGVPAPRAHLYRRTVRVSDLDVMKHVNNARFLEMVQDAHMDLLYRHETQAGLGLHPRVVYTRHELDYSAPLLVAPEPAVIGTTVGQVKRSSFRLVSRITRDGRTFCTCTSTLVAYDPDGRCPRRLDADELALLARHTDPDAAG